MPATTQDRPMVPRQSKARVFSGERGWMIRLPNGDQRGPYPTRILARAAWRDEVHSARFKDKATDDYRGADKD